MVATPPEVLRTDSPLDVDPLAQYIKERGGSRVIRKVLIANNGMAATKSILSMRQWAYMELGDEKAIKFVAMASPEDLKANAEFIRLADSFVEVPSGSNKNNYANVDLIVDIAVREQVDAVWPGWGHASENPKLPNTLKTKGIKFIGPPGPVMYVLGDKIAANILAQTAKVPSIPWSGSFGGPDDGPLVAALNEEGTIPDEIFKKAQVFTVDEAIASANRIGYPVMLKASEGGGGKGIRMSNNEEELRSNFVQVANEVPGSPMFMMQLCKNARHLEVQIVGDEHGNAVAFNGRDCSTQRRFQKIFEEGPPIIAKPETFRQMELAAMRLTQSIGYIGAGTVEYLYNAATDKFFFLELNPRLQVEHPVTEGLTGINLPATQLQVAMGIPLHMIPEVRRFYDRDLYGTDKINFLEEPYRKITNHVIAARITAENPDEGFKPTSGRIERVKFQSTPRVWGYFSVGTNGGIHEFADSQFGHLFASGPTREEARKALVLALKEIDVRGEIRNPVEYLVKLLETREFKDNNIDTSWLDGIIKSKSVSIESDPSIVVTGAAVFRSHQYIKSEIRKFEDSLNKGQTGVSEFKNINGFPMDITFGGNKYQFQVARVSPDRLRLSINGEAIDIKIREQSDGSLLCTYGGVVRKVYGQEEPLGLRMVIDGSTVMLPNIFDPSELRSDVTGKIVRFLHEDGAEVGPGVAFVECEAMKMIMQLKTTEAGTIRHRLQPGSIIGAGDLLATMELKDPSKVKKILPFTGSLKLSDSKSQLDDPFQQLSLIMEGFDAGEVEPLVSRLLLNADSATANKMVLALLTKYTDVEDNFKGKAMDAAILSLIAANKDDKRPVINLVVARQALKIRNQLALSLVRNLASFIDRYPGYVVTPEIEKVLERLSALPGTEYGEVSLAASTVYSEFKVPDYQSRLNELRDFIMSDTPQSISTSRKLSLSVDSLSELFNDPDAKVRDAAREVYVRRVYRAHNFIEVKQSESDGVATVHWKFQLRDSPPQDAPIRFGMLAVFKSINEVDGSLVKQLEEYKKIMALQECYTEPVNTFHVVLATSGPFDEAAMISRIEFILKERKDDLKCLGIRLVNVLVPQPPKVPRYFTFLECHDYSEEPLRRDMRASFPYLLELTRLQANYDLVRIPALGRNAQLWIGTEKVDENVAVTRPRPLTIFLRAISHSVDTNTVAGSDRLVLSAMDELERGILHPLVTGAQRTKSPYPIEYGGASSRIFLHVLNEYEADTQSVIKGFRSILDSLLAKHSTRLLKLRVDEIEVKARISYVMDGKRHVQPIRLVASSTSGEWLKTDAYLEYPDPVTGVAKQFRSLEEASAGVMQISPYPTSNTVQMKRASARRVGSTYAFDFLGLLEVGLIQQWSKHPNLKMPPSGTLFESKELVLGSDGELSPTVRPVGANDIGMLAWLCTIKTPEYPLGREVVLIANDVTVQSGSFGVKEDDFFFKASEYARERGLPRVYIACNSGARIGLVEELKPKFKVAWNDEGNPSAGFKYLYLTEADYNALKPGTVTATRVSGPNGDVRYALDDIIGQIHGIGVENLRGSGLIAGETSRAYQETFTLSFVTGRSVGIGAYICRLGQRLIQMVDGPLILTGYSALNKLLGKEVYTSQDQLGGPQVMFPNGISHQVVPNDQEGVTAILDWLSFVPKTKFSPSPILPVVDPVEREIGFVPTKTPYDPRHMLAGHYGPDGTFVSGFFDKDSFKEYLAGWGKSVVVGRARLGGIPMGVIAVETRLSDRRLPADPANPDSRESIEPQAGQVWFPDSAYKTAQAIEDFNRGENLPLIIFANWRGFSGGTRDMFNEILKFGSMIVDALRTYNHPVFIYLPPNGELRGGAWVVVDPTINERMMEMYADRESRGGILEPPGICEVKFRKQDQIKAMHRLDPVLIKLETQLQGTKDVVEIANLKKQISAREETLLPLYLQIAHEFADLHDRAGRMKAKGVVRDVLAWRKSREYFYWRTQRRLAELQLRNKFVEADSALTFEQVTGAMQKLIPGDWDDDRAVVKWLEGSQAAVDSHLKLVKADAVSKAVGVLLDKLPSDQRADIVSRLR